MPSTAEAELDIDADQVDEQPTRSGPCDVSQTHRTCHSMQCLQVARLTAVLGASDNQSNAVDGLIDNAAVKVCAPARSAKGIQA